jgi:hypothetical protein
MKNAHVLLYQHQHPHQHQQSHQHPHQQSHQQLQLHIVSIDLLIVVRETMKYR